MDIQIKNNQILQDTIDRLQKQNEESEDSMMQCRGEARISNISTGLKRHTVAIPQSTKKSEHDMLSTSKGQVSISNRYDDEQSRSLA